MSYIETKVIHVCPFAVFVDGVRVTVLEVVKNPFPDGSTVYSVSCRIDMHGLRTRVFTLDVRSMDELVEKLRVEIAKLKMLKYVLGESEAREIVS